MLLQVSRHCHKHKEPSAGKGTREISKSIYSCFYFCFWEQLDFTCVGLPSLHTVIRMSETLRKGCQGLVQSCLMFCSLGASLGSLLLLFLSFDNSHIHLPPVETASVNTIVLLHLTALQMCSSPGDHRYAAVSRGRQGQSCYGICYNRAHSL